MKIKGFLEDISGIKRITKARRDAVENASPDPNYSDPIREIAKEWHPGELSLLVSDICPAGKDAKSFRFVKPEGGKLPPFFPGQFLVLTLSIDGKPISRPYSITSSPSDARKASGFVEITVKKPAKDGFFADYILNNLSVGDPVTVLMGCGQFYYEPLRDAKHILALAGGVGITPFVSMAREIAEGKLDLALTVLYGAKHEDELLLWPELLALQEKCPERLRIVPVIADTSSDNQDTAHDNTATASSESPLEKSPLQKEQGFLSADLIRRYLCDPDGHPIDTSLFICGPQAMYRYLREELPKLNLPKRRIRFEVYGAVKNISDYPGYPKEAIGQTFALTVHRGIHEDVIPARASESLAVALERAGIRLETACRSGECGFCRTKVLSGSYFVSPENDGRRAADREFNYVHACAAFPTGDLEIRVPIG